MIDKNLKKMNGGESPFILIVDDIVKNLKLLDRTLESEGYDVAVAQSGMEALELIKSDPPDLILLDIMMPEMSGYDVCKKLKADENTKSIPVIFLTAKNESTDIVHGFRIGGADYITKPFDKDELLARIHTQLELKFSRDMILMQNEKLIELNREKNEIMGIAAHDLKNPLTAIKGFAEMIEMCIADEESVLDFAMQIKSISTFMFNLIRDLLDINAIEEGRVNFRLENKNLKQIVQNSVDSFVMHAAQKEIAIVTQYEDENIMVRLDAAKAKQIIDNVLSNAIKFSYPNKNVYVKMSENPANADFALIEIEDEGQGIKEEEKSKLFEKFTKLTARPTAGESSSGLGLSIVKKLTEMMGGEIWCESEFGKGSTFKFTFPLEK